MVAGCYLLTFDNKSMYIKNMYFSINDTQAQAEQSEGLRETFLAVLLSVHQMT